MGLIPITRNASSSSRMVRAPRSAHIAVAPAPATTNTVTMGPIWVTVPYAAPVPEKSAAPNSINKMLNVKINSTVNGIASINVDITDTRATNQDCNKNSRHANGGLTINTNVSSIIAKKSPNGWSGFAMTLPYVLSWALIAQPFGSTSGRRTGCDATIRKAATSPATHP